MIGISSRTIVMLPCLVCKMNGLYWKKKSISPFQNMNGTKVIMNVHIM